MALTYTVGSLVLFNSVAGGPGEPSLAGLHQITGLGDGSTTIQVVPVDSPAVTSPITVKRSRALATYASG